MCIMRTNWIVDEMPKITNKKRPVDYLPNCAWCADLDDALKDFQLIQTQIYYVKQSLIQQFIIKRKTRKRAGD